MKKTLSEIIKQAFYEINENYMQFLTAFALQGFLLMAAFLLLPPFNLILSFFVFVVTSIGIAKFSLQIVNKKKTNVESVINLNKNTVSHLVAYVVKIFQTLFFALFLIVPGIIKWLQYSQTQFVLAQNQKTTALEALNESKKLTKGSLGKVLLLKTAHFFIATVLVAFTASLIILTRAFVPFSRKVVYIWFSVMSLILLASVLMPFATITNTILYENLKLTSKFNQQPQKTFLQEVAEDFITAFSRKGAVKPNQQQNNQNAAAATDKTQKQKTTTKKATNKTTDSQKTTTKQNSAQNKKAP